MAQTLSLSIINVLHCNRRGSWIWDLISFSWPCAYHSPPLLSVHLLNCGPSREWPWTRGDLAASPQSDVIRLSRKEKGWKSIHSPSRLSFDLRCIFKGIGRTNRAVWGCLTFVRVGANVCLCAWCLHAHKHLCLFSHIKHDSQTDMEVAFGVVYSGESSRAWGDRTQSGSPLDPDGPCTGVWL